MKTKLLSLISLFIISMSSASAEYLVYGAGLTVVGDKAYLLEVSEGDSLTLDLTQYSFPNLVELKTITIDDDNYYSEVEAFETGLLVRSYSFTEEIVDNEASEKTLSFLRARVQRKTKSRKSNSSQIIYTETVINTSYNTDLEKVSELVNETKYSFFWAEVDEVNSISAEENSSGVFKVPNVLCPGKKPKKKACYRVEL